MLRLITGSVDSFLLSVRRSNNAVTSLDSQRPGITKLGERSLAP